MSRELTAAGFIVALGGAEPRYLLLRSARHQGWGFPKGHSESGEDELATALRETAEETGISGLSVIEDFAYRSSYQVSGGNRGAYLKNVVYLLALAPDQTFQISDEHDRAGWYTFEQALPLLKFESLREALRQAHKVLLARNPA